MDDVIDRTYLPFTPEQLKEHFLQSRDEQVAYYQQSADRYHGFLADPARGAARGKVALACQIEKDERFWTTAALLSLYHSAHREECLTDLLRRAFGEMPHVEGLGSWEECLAGSLQLSLETVLPSPRSYLAWLRAHAQERQLIPYVRRSCEASLRKPLEGPTHLDALLLNESNGFAVAFEAKVLSDVSCQVIYDTQRNQIARNIDVLLDANADMPRPLCLRAPERTLFVLLTPEAFRQRPRSRLYGWLFHDYRDHPESLARDLPHRERNDWPQIAQRLGWLTWEDCRAVLPAACAWL